MKLKDTCPWKESYDQPRQHVKSRDITLLTKVHLVKAMVFPVVMYGCESWMMEETLESSLNCKEVQPKGDQSWVFIGRTDAETETPVLWPPHAKS